jgi:methionyl-tRNA formyltransferase
LPQKGVVNLHPSLLPKYRGRAPINWAILKGEEEVGLTAHYVDEGMDTGDIIQQVPVSLDCYEDVGDALSKFMPLYAEMTVSVLNSIRNDSVNRTPQDHLEATTFPARRPEDGLIYWDHPAKDIVNLVRAVTKPYPGAFTHADGKKIVVWKAEIVHNNTNVEPGVITKIKPNVIEVACGRGSMRLLNYEPSFKPNLGQALG